MSRRPGHPPVVLSIAGSDPSGGAGIQADLKTFSALGAYGCAVITSLTAQNTRGVTGVFAVPASFVAEQLDTLFADVHIDAVKIGMLANAEVAMAVVAALDRYRPANVVLDPVMVATSGDRLLSQDAESVVRAELMPRADIVTPNLAEAAALLGAPVATDLADASIQVDALLAAGARRVLLKGGHLLSTSTPRSATDLLGSRGSDTVPIEQPWVDTRNTHGTGCTLSSAMAALRTVTSEADPSSWLQTCTAAKAYLTQALQGADSLQIGSGHGPVSHFSGMTGWSA
jgi:hydroxymethylpyrimidine/phosphomethylpyrimidine kinase